ncbi:hypothetical protein B0H14DRAFT_3523093 [Mycena olivaceomarginata]|nr:hypothetical protein B0H14DRAFT_3523093 [Mycena olivaceomarginata]
MTHAALRTARNRAMMNIFEQQMWSTPDVRVVLVAVPDFFDAWERGVRSGNNMWMHVEDFIARKQRGEVDATTYILDKGDPWV